MRVRVTLHGAFSGPKERDADVPDGATADDLVRTLGIDPEMVVVFRGDTPIPGDERVNDGEALRVLRVVSGGALDLLAWDGYSAPPRAQTRRTLL